jgi:hypothetical protein
MIVMIDRRDPSARNWFVLEREAGLKEGAPTNESQRYKPKTEDC